LVDFDETTVRVLDLLAPLGVIVPQQLFGAVGLYLEERIFGIVHDGVVYFRTSELSREAYVVAGSKPFMFQRADGRSAALRYHSVPSYVLEDTDLACGWALRATAVE
jgi:DNA transformation protein